MTQNQINYQKLLEENRSNTAREAETHRANLRNEEIAQGNLDELKRSNLARETENFRSNTTRERETNRSNLANEIETNRANTVREAETERHNRAEESLKKYTADSALAGTMYSADRSYAGRTDTAYINKYGVTPSTAQTVGKGVVSTIKALSNTPAGQKVNSKVQNLMLHTAVSVLAAPKVVNSIVNPPKKNKQSKYKAGGGTRH